MVTVALLVVALWLAYCSGDSSITDSSDVSSVHFQNFTAFVYQWMMFFWFLHRVTDKCTDDSEERPTPTCRESDAGYQPIQNPREA